MKLKTSPKIFNNYKCDYPKNTIRRIEKGFKKINLNLEYGGGRIGQNIFSIYAGEAFFSNLIFPKVKILTRGKGTTLELAKASAYAEMAERFSCGLYFPDFVARIHGKNASTKKIANENLLNNFRNFSYLKGYVNKENFKEDPRFGDFLKNITDYFSEEMANNIIRSNWLDSWVDAYSLNENLYKKIPLRFIREFSASNGLASGSTIEEAIVQAINEIFERYAFIHILENKTEIPTIDINSIEDKTVLGFIKFFESMNFKIIIKDFSMGNTLPSMGVLFINNNLKNETNQLKKDLFFRRIRVGAHLDRNQALIRCFTEECQVDGPKEIIFHKFYDILWNNWVLKMGKKYNPIPSKFFNDLINYKYHSSNPVFLEKGKTISFKDLFSFKINDCLYELNKLIEICDKNKWEALVVDQTHPIINFPAVRVIILPISFMVEVDYLSKDEVKIAARNNNEFKKSTATLLKKLNYYSRDDDWTRSKKEIEQLLSDIEFYLSENLFNPSVNVVESGKYCDLFNLAAFANLETGNYQEALNYFTLLKEIYSSNKNLNYIYTEICNFLKKDLLLHSFSGGAVSRYLSKTTFFINKMKLKRFLNKLSKCFEFFLFSSSRNHLSDFCDNCDERCAWHFSNNLELCMRTFFNS